MENKCVLKLDLIIKNIIPFKFHLKILMGAKTDPQSG